MTSPSRRLSLLLLSLALAASLAAHAMAGSTNPLNDPDLPGYTAPMTDMAVGSIIIPFGTLQGTMNSNGNHLFNFATYGLVAHLLWRDIPLRFALKGGKLNTTEIDFSVSTLKLWPRSPASQLTTPQVRDFDGGAFVVPANLARFAWVHILDYVNGTARQERAAYVETNTVVVFNATAAFQIPLRYTLNTKPFISVMDSSSFAFVQVLHLRWAGFVFGQHYKQMNYAEANSIGGDTCVSFISEPHFTPGSTEAVNFQAGMREFIEAGGNFIAQCGGIGTYEQCDLSRSSPAANASCPRGFIATTPGGFRIHSYQSYLGRMSGTVRLDQEDNFAADTLYGQYQGLWTWAYGDIESLNTWDQGRSSLNSDNGAHWVVGARATSQTGGLTYYAAHAKLKKFHGKTGGNVFYLTGHEYTPFDGKLTRFDDYRIASPAGMRLWLNGLLHPANRTGCRATVTMPDGTIRDVGELTIDPCRYDSSAPECNTVYECSAPKYSGYYREGWNYGVELLASYPLSFTMNVTLPNRIAILNVLDSNNFATSSSSTTNGGTVNHLTALHRTIPYIYNLLQNRWNRVWAALAVTTGTSPSYYSLLRPFVSSKNAFTVTAPNNRRDGTTRVLNALLAALQDPSLLWDGSVRVVHLYTNSTAPASNAVPSGLVAALTSAYRPAVVIVVPRQSIVSGWEALNLPRTRVVVSVFPTFTNPLTADENSPLGASVNLLTPVITATDELLSNFNVYRGADPIGISSSVTTASMSFATQTSDMTSLTATTNQVLNLALTNNYGVPGGPTYSPMPYRLQWDVAGLDTPLTVAVFWSEFASALPFTATTLENTDVTVPIATRLRLASTATSTKDIFLEILNITKDGGNTDVWATDFAYIKTADGNITQKGQYYRTDDFTFRTNPGAYGEYIVNYRVYDRCVRSESRITLTVTRLNQRPVGTNFTYYLVPGEDVTIQWFNPTPKISDRETPNNNLRFSFDSFSIPNSGTLQVFTGGSWSPLVPSTLYPVSTPVRFLSTQLSSVNASFLYNVWDSDNTNNVVPVYARFEFTAPPNLPPVIAVTPATNPTLTTAQTLTDTFQVTVTDFIADLTTELNVEDISVAWGEITSLRPTGPVDTRTYNTFNTQLSGTVLISSIALTSNGVNNTHTFTFTWTPSASAPFGATYTFVLFARDPRGLISNKVTVTLRTPANVAPVVVGFVPTAIPTFPESSTLINRNLDISSTDANLIHTERLNLTITSLPTLGTLYRDDCTTAIAVGDTIPYTAEAQSNNRTITSVCYVARVYTSGVDTFNVRATDLAGLSSPITPVRINITAVNFPPTTVNITRTTDGPITFTIPSSDPDGDALTFTIIEVNVPAIEGTLVNNATGVPIAPGQTFTPTQSNNGWARPFTYTPNDNRESHIVNFTYRVTDPGGLNSSVHWAIINFTTDYRTPIPPNSLPANFTILEDTTLTIVFDPLVNDTDGELVSIRIVTLPFSTLLGPTSTTLSPGSTFSRASNGSFIATYVPPLNFNGVVRFEYVVNDDQGLSSNASLITITVLPVNDPPVIEAEPNLVVVERTQTGTFTINISDVDSTTVSLVIAADNTIPQPSTLSGESFTLSGVAEVLVRNVTNPNLGQEIPLTLSWTPGLSLPDGATGTFTVFAVDTELLSSVARPVLRVEVVANDPPTIVPTYTYSFTVDEDFAPFTITLGGTDPQPYHREVLDVLLLSLPDVHGVELFQSATSVQLGTLTSAGANNETTAVVTANSKLNFHGTVSFTFQVRDLLGALSAIQVVEITVVPVNDPPVSADEVLTVMENTCFSSAASCATLTPIEILTPAVLRASDPDQDPLTLRFTSLPPTGTLYYKNGDALDVVTLTSTFDSTAGSSWQFLYEPAPGEHSTCTDDKNPTVATCTPFTTAPFTVSDGTSQVNQVLSIYVFPINDPPTGDNLVFTINEDENLTIVLPAADPDDDVLTLITRTTGIAPGSRGNLTTSTGVEVPFSGELDTESDKTILFTPLPDDFSGPNNFYARFFYQVVDPGGLISAEYTVTIYVLPVADDLELRSDPFIRMPEDTTGSFVLGREGVNWYSKDKGEFFIRLNSIPDVGVLTVCVGAECTNLTEDDLDTDFNPLAVFSYTPPPDAFGENFTTFSYDMVLRPEGITVPTVTTVNFTIHVDPVNDPPVLVALFPITPNSTIFDEDTTETLTFEATDIDTPLDQLTAQIVHGLSNGVSMKVYSCIASANLSNGCADGPEAEAFSDLPAATPARWIIGLVPAPNANGNARLTFVINDGDLLSAPVVAPIVVRPINDAPEILNPTVSATASAAKFSFTGRDIDFVYRAVDLTFTDLSGLGSFDLGNDDADSQDEDVKRALAQGTSPCVVNNGTEMFCTLPIVSIPSWLEVIRYKFGDGASGDRQIKVVLDDRGDIDYRPGMNLNDTVILTPVVPAATTLVAATPSGVNSIALIAGAIGGLLFGGIIAALAFFFLRKNAASKVNAYFEQMAIDMDGSTNTSPLYQGAAKGGESVLYKGAK